MKLSVIIPSRNRYPNLVNTLEGLARQTLDKSEYEVILSDDNSTDETQSLINQFKDRMRFKYVFSNVPKPHSWNAAVVRNIGALASDPSTMAYYFVDSDIILPDFVLKNVVDDLEKDPNRVIIGPYDFLTKNGDKVQYPNKEEGDMRGSTFREKPVENTYNSPTDGLACFGGNLVIPKDIFWSVKGFSVDTHIGLEDGDMGLKLWKKGVRFSYDGRNRGTHQYHETPPDRFPPDMKQHIDNLNLKHFGTKDPDYGIVEASRETYESWGITGWEVPEQWLANQLSFMLKITK